MFISLVTASTDGRICVWDTDQLQQALDVFDLRIALSIVSTYTAMSHSADKKIEASVMAFAIHQKDKNYLYVGTESGKIYVTNLDPQRSKNNTNGNPELAVSASIREVLVDPISQEAPHFGHITAMHFHPLLPVHREGLLLTCSLDSTVKLWSTQQLQAPVLSFEPSNDYICDVRWSSTHPSLFAVADSSGHVSIWNICKDVEVAVIEAKVSDRAVNRLRWSADGKKIIIGDAGGNTLIYRVPEEV